MTMNRSSGTNAIMQMHEELLRAMTGGVEGVIEWLGFDPGPSPRFSRTQLLDENSPQAVGCLGASGLLPPSGQRNAIRRRGLPCLFPLMQR